MVKCCEKERKKNSQHGEWKNQRSRVKKVFSKQKELCRYRLMSSIWDLEKVGLRQRTLQDRMKPRPEIIPGLGPYQGPL